MLLASFQQLPFTTCYLHHSGRYPLPDVTCIILAGALHQMLLASFQQLPFTTCYLHHSSRFPSPDVLAASPHVQGILYLPEQVSTDRDNSAALAAICAAELLA